MPVFEDILLLLLLVAAVFIIVCAWHPRIITYYVHSSPAHPDFVAQVVRILENSPWKAYHKYQLATTPENATINIWLKPVDFMDRFTRDKPEYYHTLLDERGQPLNSEPGNSAGRKINFSITVYSNPERPVVYINEANWIGCPESGLGLDEYRDYVINHEFGHALGYDHQPCNAKTAPDGVCPVMYQATRGPPVGFLCGSQPRQVDTSARIF